MQEPNFHLAPPQASAVDGGKATPGPWEAAHASIGLPGGSVAVSEWFVRRPNDCVAIAADICDPETGIPSEANARLIASVPALRTSHAALAKALEAIVEMTDPEPDGENYRADDREGCLDAVHEAARAALAEAQKVQQ
jgi:hypothetical protein